MASTASANIPTCRHSRQPSTCAIVDNWGANYIRRVRELMEGRWQSASSWGGMAEALVETAPYNPVISADVVNEAEAIHKSIISGDLHPFAGPIIKRNGQ